MLNGPKPFIEKTIFLLTAQKCHLWNSSSACIYVSLPWPTGPFDKFLFWSIGPFDQVCCCSVSQSCQTLCDLMNCRLLCPSPSPGGCTNSCPLSQWCHPTISSSVILFSSHFNLSQHQGLFKWVSSSQKVAKVLEFQLQHQSFHWIFRTDFL